MFPPETTAKLQEQRNAGDQNFGQHSKIMMQEVVNTALFSMAAALAYAQDDTLSPILIANVNVFDGANETLIEDTNVVVTGNLITAVSAEPLAVAAHTFNDDAVRISLEAGGEIHRTRLSDEPRNHGADQRT